MRRAGIVGVLLALMIVSKEQIWDCLEQLL